MSRAKEVPANILFFFVCVCVKQCFTNRILYIEFYEWEEKRKKERSNMWTTKAT